MPASVRAPRSVAPATRRANRKDLIMKLSARNIIPCTVKSIEEGSVNGIVTLSPAAEPAIKANITMDAIRDLGLREGAKALAIVKASNVMFAAGREPIAGISARNQLVGTVKRIEKGAVNGHVALELGDGVVITGSITNSAIDDLDLREGGPAVAIVKSTDVIVGVE